MATLLRSLLLLCVKGAWGSPEWSFKTCGEWPSEPVAADEDGEVLVVTSGRCMHLLNATSGEELWRHQGADDRTSTPCTDVKQGLIFYGHEASDGTAGRFSVKALDTTSRRVHWDRGFAGFPSRPVLSGDGARLFFGDELEVPGPNDGSVYCVSALTGDTVWKVSMPGAVRAAPAISSRTAALYVTDRSGAVSALSLEDGSALWRVSPSDVAHSSPVEHPTALLLFVGAHNYRMLALNSSTGELVWNFTTRNFASSTPVLSPQGEHLYFVSNDGHAYSLDAFSGALVWRKALCVSCEWPPNSVPIISKDGERLILGGGEKLLVVLDRRTGNELWHSRLPSLVYGRAAESVDGKHLIVPSGAGLVTALRADGQSSDTCPTDNTWPPAEMADNSHCDSIGLSDLSPYRYGLPLPTEGLGASDPSGFLPYFSSHPLDGEERTEITNAVIWIHGLMGNANKFFCDGIAAAESSGAQSSTLTLTPWFGDVKQDTTVWNATGPTPSGQVSTCWKTSSWLKGGNSYPSASNGKSTFTLVDALVNAVQASKAFPNLQKVTLAGFSAGCQLLTRWSFFSSVAMDTSVIVGDCGTYMYLDTTRPDTSCNALSNTGTDHSCSKFDVPGPADAPCAGYDDYKYGIDVSSVQNNNFVQPFASNPERLEEALTNFSQKDIRFLQGDDDVCQCTFPGMSNAATCFPKGAQCAPTDYSGCCDTYPDSTTHNACSSTCEAMLTGSNRLQRGLNYARYLENFYAKRGVTYETQIAFFDGSHDNTAWSLSSSFSLWAGWVSETSRVAIV